MRSQYGSNVIPLAVIISIATYIAMDSIFLRAFPGQRVAYAGIVVVSIIVAILGLARLMLATNELLLLGAWILLNIVWLLMIFGHDQVYATWAVGDFVSMMLPVIFLLIGLAYPGLFINYRLLMVLGALLLVGAILGAIIGIGPNSRFESPTTLLFPLVWIQFFASRGIRKLAFGLVLAMLAALAIGAGERTGMVLWILSGLAVYSLTWPLRRLIVSGILLAMLVVGFGSTIYQSAVRDAVEQTRFRQNINGTIDASLVTRINEARDVAREFSASGVGHQLLGHGHGANFRPVESHTLQNISAEGYLHHVHIGSALIIYRYGIVGLFVLLWVWTAVVRYLVQQRALGSIDKNLSEAAFALALLMYLVDLFLRNVIADPAFSFIVAGFLFHQSRRRLFALADKSTMRTVANA